MFYGASYWRFMHHFALHNQGRDLMLDLGQFIGCEKCASEYEPPADDQDLVIWSKDLHNKVNGKLGKWDKWDMTDFHIGHKPDCDICTDVETHFGYPWIFIHNVAETGNAAAIPFLQKFNQIYPCDKCRGTILSDPPLEGESAIDWTVRNHQKVQPMFKYFPPPSTNIATTSECSGCPNPIPVDPTIPLPPGVPPPEFQPSI